MTKLPLFIFLKIFVCIFLKPLLGLDEDEVESRRDEFLSKLTNSTADFIPNILVETLGSNLEELSDYRESQVNFNLAKAILETWSERLKILERNKNAELKELSAKTLSLTLTSEDKQSQEQSLQNAAQFLNFLSKKLREATYRKNFAVLEDIFVNNLASQKRAQSDIFTALKDKNLAEKIFWKSIKSSMINWAEDENYSLPNGWQKNLPEQLEKEIQTALFDSLEIPLAKKVKANPQLEKTLNYYVGFDTNKIVKDLIAIIEGEGEPDREIIRKYLAELIKKADELPKYLVNAESNQGKEDLFAHIRQKVEICDRKELEKFRAEREQQKNFSGAILPPIEGYVQKVEWREEIVEKFHRVIILGKPGVGKSWLLRYEAKRLASKTLEDLENNETELEEISLPVWVNLADWAKRCGEMNYSLTSLVDLIIEKYTDVRPDNRKKFNIFQVWLMRKLRSDNCVILLDALDEIPRNIDFSDRLKTFSEKDAKTAKIYLTCREAEYKGSPIVALEDGVKEIKLLEFEDEQISQFYNAWFGEDSEKAGKFSSILDNSSSVHELTRIPLLLSLTCALFDKYQNPDDFPSRRVEIYEKCIDRLFLKEWKDQAIGGEWTIKKVKEMLSWVGFQIFSTFGEQFNEEELEELIEKWHFRKKYAYSPEKSQPIIKQLITDGLITTAAENENNPRENEYLFLHRTFLEYFAAGGLVELNKKADKQTWEDVVFQETILYDPNWSEVLQLLGGKLESRNVKRYITRLLEINGESGEGDVFFRPFKLGVMVAIEAGNNLEKDLRDLLMIKTLENYYEPPQYLGTDDFFPLVKLWGKSLTEFIMSEFNAE